MNATEFAGFVVAVGLIAAAALGLSYGIDSYICRDTWRDSGMPSRYRIGGGCQVQRKDGTWVPANMVREVGP